jgi:hypothetical protein
MVVGASVTAMGELRQQQTGMQGRMPWSFKQDRRASLKGGNAALQHCRSIDLPPSRLFWNLDRGRDGRSYREPGW